VHRAAQKIRILHRAQASGEEREGSREPEHSNRSLVLNEHFEEDGMIVLREACKLGCEGIVSKRLGSPDRSGRVSTHFGHISNMQ
jgi:ATP-dependent DNA ligase